ncbi:ABC transporter ATPase [Clostridium botulinum]|nr:ABC transporter ATPase [Clostridium botulinum]NFO92295.1 ABC transporter ATPase [Clostridium botulinum]
MKELSTIQKREKLNTVERIGSEGPGGAYHEYVIKSNSMDSQGNYDVYETIKFQKGARKEEKSQHGVIDSDLLEIVRDRLKSFQAGPFSSRENACALTHVEEALMWMNRRVEDRIERNVLGRNEK